MTLSWRQIWPFGELTVGPEAGELRAGAGAARASIVRAAGAEDEATGVVFGVSRRAEQLDVVDLGPGFVRLARRISQESAVSRSTLCRPTSSP